MNTGPVKPPQRNGRLPQYARNKLVDLQNKFDELEKLGVFKRPKNINVSVEYLYPSFLATKSNGGYRLVTAFSDVRSYSKPQPSLTPDVDSTLRQSLSGDTLLLLIITTHECLVSNPSRTRVDEILRRSQSVPWGPGIYLFSNGHAWLRNWNSCVVYLETLFTKELLPRSPTMYTAEPTHHRSYYTICKRVLQALSNCNLKLSTSKTVINPKWTVILVWIWDSGTL